mgnify:FL=1
MSSFAVTHYFKNIFPDYISFQTFVAEYTNVDKTEDLNAYIYKYLYARYCNSNINYDTIDAFKRHFGITYEDTYEQLKMRKNILIAQYNLTLEELSVINKAINTLTSSGITNNAQNNAVTNLVNPLEELLPYIDNQTSNKFIDNSTAELQNNLLNSYLNALNKVTDKFLNDYLYKFAKHFMVIVDLQYYNYP